MRAVVTNLLLTALIGGQVPLPLPPELPLSPSPIQLPMPEPDADLLPLPFQKELSDPPLPAPGHAPFRDVRGQSPPPQKEFAKPAPLVPVHAEYQPSGMPPIGSQINALGGGDGTKPPPFKLIENNPPVNPPPVVEGPQLKPVPNFVAEPLPPVAGAATPSLLLSRTGPSSVKAGQPFSYEIVIRNTGGNAQTTPARLEEEFPPGTKLLSAQPAPVVQSDRLTWMVDNLAPGAERRFRIEAEASRDGDWKASATLTISVSSGLRTSVTGTLPQQAIVMNGPAGVPVGHPVSLQIRVTNTTGAPLTDTMLRVQLSSGLQHLHGDAIEAPLGELSPGQTKDLVLEAVTMKTGRLSADATLLSRQKGVAVGRYSLNVADQPILTIRQTGPLSAPMGSEHEYKLEIINRSAGELRDAVVSDELPEGVQFASGDMGAQFDLATRKIRWNLGTLLPGQIRQVTFRAQMRGTGPQMNRVSARAAGVAEAQLYTILRVGGAR